MISGQLIGALLLDLLLPAAGTGISVSTVAGVLITLLAAAVASMPDRAGRAVPRLPR
jgi:transporter family-2 protein